MAKQWIIAAVTLTGCVGVDGAEDELGTATQEVEVDNGVSLNGVSLNGVSLNGVSLNGVSLNGVSLNGVSLNGTSLDAVAITGSTWTAMLSNGTSLPLRIDAASSAGDVGMYAVSYHSDSGWSPLCGTDGGAPILAVAVPGVWNTQSGVPGGGAYSQSADSFTLACRGKTIGKCVELGYKPWAGYAMQLATCVRVLRADYCGDGTPHTIDGQRINLYDNAHVQLDTQAWEPEAEWTPHGARCVSKSGELRFRQLRLATPSCIVARTVPVALSCAKSFSANTVIINEIPDNLAGL
jgi:hypothetical protein